MQWAACAGCWAFPEAASTRGRIGRCVASACRPDAHGQDRRDPPPLARHNAWNTCRMVRSHAHSLHREFHRNSEEHCPMTSCSPMSAGLKRRMPAMGTICPWQSLITSRSSKSRSSNRSLWGRLSIHDVSAFARHHRRIAALWRRALRSDAAK